MKLLVFILFVLLSIFSYQSASYEFSTFWEFFSGVVFIMSTIFGTVWVTAHLLDGNIKLDN